MTMQKPLAKAFDLRKSALAHRASAIFPLRVREHADLHIVFLNYWLLKNDITRISVNFRCYDCDGELRVRKSLERVDEHNQISLRDQILLPGGVTVPFDGMVDVEIVSHANLAFPFPAIMGIYESNGFFSAVHASGRIKNADESKNPQHSEETNWNCKFERGGQGNDYSIVPFFHYFVGAVPLPADEIISVSLRDSAGAVQRTVVVPVGEMQTFSSRTFFADELFTLDRIPEEGSFLSVKLKAWDVFPRLVVGNFHRSIDFLEVTHSFPATEFVDHCPVPESIQDGRGFPSLLAAQTGPGLELEVRVFPTNCVGAAQAKVSSKSREIERLQSLGEVFSIESAVGQGGFSFSLGASEEMRVLHLSGAQIPSRLNASYMYKVADAPKRFSTDIATGAKSIVYPPKWRHWGHGCIGGGFDSLVFFRNNSHVPEVTLPNLGKVRFIGPGIDQVIPLHVHAESCVALRLSEVLNIDAEIGVPTFVSWIMSMEQPVGETFWIAFRSDGAIFGEHGF